MQVKPDRPRPNRSAHQAGQDARGESQGREGKFGLSGLHSPLRSRPVGKRQAISKCGAVEECVTAGAGPDQRTDGSPSALHADPAPDRNAESATEGLGELLFVRLSEQGVPEDQLAPWLPAGESLEAPSQPAPLPTTGGNDILRAPFQRLGLEFWKVQPRDSQCPPYSTG